MYRFYIIWDCYSSFYMNDLSLNIIFIEERCTTCRRCKSHNFSNEKLWFKRSFVYGFTMFGVQLVWNFHILSQKLIPCYIYAIIFWNANLNESWNAPLFRHLRKKLDCLLWNKWVPHAAICVYNSKLLEFCDAIVWFKKTVTHLLLNSVANVSPFFWIRL